MKIDISKTAIENVFALINADNGSTHDAATVTLGVPAVRTPDANPRNTTLVLTAVVGGGFTGTDTVTYTRLGMGSGVVTPSFDFETDGDTTNASFKTQVATALGLREDQIQITGTLPAAEGDETTMTVAAIADSLLYVGSQALTVTWPVPQVPLDLTTKDLSGFEAEEG